MTIVDRTYDLPDLISGRDNLSYLIISVGVAGFEPTTSCSQSRRDTGLRYTPNNLIFIYRQETCCDIFPGKPQISIEAQK